MMTKLVNFYHFRSRNTKFGPRPGEGQASRLNPISRPLICSQDSITDQGTLEASITLSPEAFGIASLNVGASKGGKKAW
ncbi:Zinc finger and BTB domain-containing 44 [Gossypium arboreum]|uniref:Zinc finger and BTB domain-containing 44 n=1 Tax=Gossypium arboreum TaxID=29729 RepID=A0A0B0NQ62_GOSAR|nr:Zinc finger and BTB domain-containing 44 [Gossypium arboreum]